MEMLPIDRALDEYAFSLKSLDAIKPPKKLRVDQVLSVLVARDEVQRSMGADDCAYSVESVRRLIELDERLRKGARRMARVVRERELERWRSSTQPEETAWWWWLERVVDHPLNRMDGLWRLMMVAGWTANITLMVNLAAKFLGLVVGAAIAVPSVLGLQLPVFSKMDSRGGVTSYQAGKLGDAERVRPLFDTIIK